MVRITIRLISPVAMPENPDKIENPRMAGINTLRRPILSEMPPIRIANTPHARPNAPMMFPAS